MKIIKVGIIGYGYWGPNLVRNFSEPGYSQVVTVSDLSEANLKKAQASFSSIQICRDYRDLLKDPAIDAIAVATPVSTHFEIGMAVLRAKKHLFIEKPMASSSKEASQLIEESERAHLTLMVDHIFVYTPAVRKIKDLISSGEMGEIYYYDSVRVNLGLFQHDVNVIWDLAVHDLSIMDYVLSEKPTAILATGINHFPNEQYNMAYLTLFFNNTMIAHIHNNWLAPVKIRQTLIGGSKKMLVYDDLEPSDKLKIYDKRIELSKDPEGIRKLLVDYRYGDMWSPHLDSTEALKSAALHFVDCIQHQKKPTTGGLAGLRVVEILEAATQSLENRGQLVQLATETKKSF